MKKTGRAEDLGVPAPRRPRPSYHHGNLRAALMEAAVQLIAERGPHGFLLSDAARLVQVSNSAPYRHFKDKAGLVAAVAEEGFSILCAELEAIDPSVQARPIDHLQGIALTYVDVAARFPAHFQVMTDATVHHTHYPEVDRLAERSFATLQDAVLRYLRVERPSAESSSLTASLLALMQGFAVLNSGGSLKNLNFEASVHDLVKQGISRLLAPLQPV